MLFIFDWDGTISDSTDKIAECLAEAIEELGLPERTVEERKNIIGLGLSEAILTLFPDLNESRVRKMRDAYSKHYLIKDHNPSPLFPGSKETMDALKDAGHSIAVATGKSRRGLDRILDRLNLQAYFHGTRCADETASKPDPQMVLELIAELNFAADQCVLVGDTEYDLEMASRAGVRSVGVDYGAHHVSRLEKHSPIMLISEFSELLKLVD